MQKDKVFLTMRGAIEGRIDAYYHKPLFTQLREKYKQKGFCHLGTIITNWNRGDGPREGFYTEDAKNGVYFLRINNLTENTIDLTEVKYINRDVHEKTLKRSQVTAGDLIFAISGTKDNLGTVAIIPSYIKEANLNSALITLQLAEGKIDKNYFCLLFDMPFIRTQIDYIGKGAAQNNLNSQEIAQIQIPLLDLAKQKEIVSLMQAAYASKRAKEAEAAALLGSIDAYLMAELGIASIAGSAGFQNPPNLNKPYFLASAQELRGNRWDSAYYKEEYKELEKAINKSSYSIVFLKDILAFIESGSRPIGGISEYESGILSLGGEHVNDKCQIEINNPRFIPLEYHQHHLNTETKLHDILLVKDGATTGKIGVIENMEQVNQNINEHVFLMRFKEGVNSYYVLYLLATSFYQKRIKRVITGATVTGLTKQVIKEMSIPVPPLPHQQAIALHISELRSRAKALQAEAAAEIAAAKAQVEEMLLG